MTSNEEISLERKQLLEVLRKVKGFKRENKGGNYGRERPQDLQQSKVIIRRKKGPLYVIIGSLAV